MYHSRNVVKRQERPLAVVVSSSDARACPHGLHRASDLRVRTLAGQHAIVVIREDGRELGIPGAGGGIVSLGPQQGAEVIQVPGVARVVVP